MARTSTAGTKQKRSFTLSPDSVRFLDQLKRKRRAASVSFVLEELVQNARKAAKARALDRAVDGYYSSLNPRGLSEDALWGELSFEEFSNGER